MMFADREGVDANLFGEDRFVNDIAEGLRLGLQRAAGIGGDVTERVEAQLKRVRHLRHR